MTGNEPQEVMCMKWHYGVRVKCIVGNVAADDISSYKQREDITCRDDYCGINWPLVIVCIDIQAPISC